MLLTTELNFGYNSENKFRYPAMESNADKPLLITGKSGCGKTTLLHLLGGLLIPNNGNIKINDTDVTELSTAALDAFRGKQIGIIFQKPHFIASMNVWDNIVMSNYCSGKKEAAEHIRKITSHLNIDQLLHKPVLQLSQGEQQRVSIARAVSNKPSLLLADEPTSSLDDENAEQVIALLKQLSAIVSSTLVIVTHDERVKKHFTNTIQL